MLVIDGNSLAWRFQRSRRIVIGGGVAQGEEIQMAHGFLNALQEIVSKFPLDTILVLWDGRSKYRHSLYPEYKANRKKIKESKDFQSFKAQLPFVKSALTKLGISHIRHEDYEADDVAAFLTRTVGKTRIYLVTSDQDWAQLVSDSVTWFDHKDQSEVTPKNFKEIIGLDGPKQLIELKALTGDSDNIKGVGGIGPKAAHWILETYGSVNRLIFSYQGGEEICPPIKRYLRPIMSFLKNETNKYGMPAQEQYSLNIRLIDLNQVDVNLSGASIEYGKLDINGFYDLCLDYEFQASPAWARPFLRSKVL